ncbi:hypothetical protein D1F72_15055, partial [Staphylococcus aureus]
SRSAIAAAQHRIPRQRQSRARGQPGRGREARRQSCRVRSQLPPTPESDLVEPATKQTPGLNPASEFPFAMERNMPCLRLS